MRQSRLVVVFVLALALAAAVLWWPLTPLTDSPTGRAAASVSSDQADLFNTLGTTRRLPVRGRIFEEPLDADPARLAPIDVVAHDTLDDTMIDLELVSADGATHHTLSTVRTDADGDLDHVLTLHDDLGITPGTWTLRATLDGRTLGEASAHLLAEDWSGLLVRSDVDRTWLVSDFDDATAVAELLRADAHARQALPAMDVVLARLRQGSDGARPAGLAPLVFITGSPMIFQQTLEARAALDGLTVDGLVLKPIGATIVDSLLGASPTQVVPALREQVGYKLYTLLKLREDMPPAARELLLGDDSEADHVAYTLYHQLTAGTLDLDTLGARLRSLDVDDTWRHRIESAAGRVRTHLGASPQPTPVQAIYLRRSGKPSERHPPDDWDVPGVVRYHDDTWSLALDLYEEGRFTDTDVDAVRAALNALGVDDDLLLQQAEQAVDEGLLEAATATRFAEN